MNSWGRMVKLDCWPYQQTDSGHLYSQKLGGGVFFSYMPGTRACVNCSSNEIISGIELHLNNYLVKQLL